MNDGAYRAEVEKIMFDMYNPEYVKEREQLSRIYESEISFTHTSHIKYAYQPMLHKRSVVKTTFQDSKATLFTADSVRNKYTGRLPIT